MSLPALQSSEGFTGFKSYSKPTNRPIEPVGRYFLAHALRSLRGHTWSEYEKIEASQQETTAQNDDDDLDFDDNQPQELLEHDPRDWKTCDLYAALGLSKYRYRATEDDIKKAYRKSILLHHPDKKSASGGLEEDGFFKIIQKAYEYLMDPVKRQQLDSVDENADVEPPSAKSKYDFFEAWGPVFESESRFSNKKPAPQLGDITTPKPQVDAFYGFWYHFDSWRTFEFLDEDVPDDTANRDHKRYVERKNKAARTKKKNEDNRRISDLVKRALAEDPRIKLFKEQEKEEKAKRKWDREAGARQAAEEAKLKKEAEEKAAKEAEDKAKTDRESSKKAKEAAKNAKKKNKRAVRSAAKDADYFGEADKASTIDLDLGVLVDSFDDLLLGDVATNIKGKDAEGVKAVLKEAAAKQLDAKKVSGLKYFN